MEDVPADNWDQTCTVDEADEESDSVEGVKDYLLNESERTYKVFADE